MSSEERASVGSEEPVQSLEGLGGMLPVSYVIARQPWSVIPSGASGRWGKAVGKGVTLQIRKDKLNLNAQDGPSTHIQLHNVSL